MLTQTDLERERYEARRKAQLDENTLMKVAGLEGEKKGRRKEISSSIHFCERFLKRPESPSAVLAAMSLDDLARLAEELQAQVLQQR
jgi:hypothetical protein